MVLGHVALRRPGKTDECQALVSGPALLVLRICGVPPVTHTSRHQEMGRHGIRRPGLIPCPMVTTGHAVYVPRRAKTPGGTTVTDGEHEESFWDESWNDIDSDQGEHQVH